MDGEEPFNCSSNTIISTKKKNKNKNKRFSDEQIKTLESMFESETRVEPRRKLQLAKELGLQPRQVAIWFQNKRARWKSKQLERDYNILRLNYSNLVSRFEALKKEKQALLVQLQKLNEQTKKQGEVEHYTERKVNVTVTSSEGESQNGDRGKCELIDAAMKGGVVSDEDSSIKAECFGLEDEPNLVSCLLEPAEGSLTSREDWGSLDSNGLFDQPNSECQWWDFWA